MTKEEMLCAFSIDMRRIIGGLPERQRDAVLYCYTLEFTTEEAARILGCTHQTVSRSLQKAFATIEKKLSKKGCAKNGARSARIYEGGKIEQTQD
jgi:RNA polymerase sigma factor (sigma-70 family)